MIGKKNIKYFKSFLDDIRCISDKDYQKRIWVRHEDLNIVDSYDDTTMYFLEDAEGLLDAVDEGRVEMTEKQYSLLKKFYEEVDTYDSKEDRPESDADIVEDPKWEKIREFAKIVYEELRK